MFPAFARFAIRFRRPVVVVAVLLVPLLAWFGGNVFADLKPGGFDAAVDPSVITVLNYFDTPAPQLLSDDGRSTIVVISLRGNDEQKIAAVKRLEPKMRVPGVDVKFGGISPAFKALNDTAES